MELTQGRHSRSVDTPRKALSRRLGVGQDWLVPCEVHLCTQIGSFKNAIYNLIPICFQRRFGKCKKQQNCVNRNGRLIHRLLDSKSALSFILNFLVPKAKGSKKDLSTMDLYLHVQILQETVGEEDTFKGMP